MNQYAGIVQSCCDSLHIVYIPYEHNDVIAYEKPSLDENNTDVSISEELSCPNMNFDLRIIIPSLKQIQACVCAHIMSIYTI